MKALINFKENIPLIAIFLNGLGYITLSNYYSRFGIDIVYYISLSDILFYVINSFIKLTIIVLVYTLLSDIVVTYITKLLSIKSRNKVGIYNLNHIIAFLIVIILGFAVGEVLYAFVFATTGLLLNLEFVENKKDEDINNNTEQIGDDTEDISRANTLNFLVLLLIPLSFFLGLKNGTDLEQDIYYVETPKIVEFRYEDKFISTKDAKIYRFIGETSSHIFIYNVKTKASLILDKSEMKSFVCIKNHDYLKLKYRYLNFDRFLKVWYDGNKNFFED